MNTVVIPAPRAPETDERWQIVTRAQHGDPTAFADLYRLYQPTVYSVIYRRVQNPTLAEDLTQDVFVRALRNLGSVRWQGRDIGAWLVTIARNIAMDHFKSGRYRYERLVGADRPEDPDLDRRTDPALVAVHNDLAGLLGGALAELTVDQRAVLALRFGAGLSLEETARVMGRRADAVKSLQHRAVKAAGVALRRAGVTPC